METSLEYEIVKLIKELSCDTSKGEYVPMLMKLVGERTGRDGAGPRDVYFHLVRTAEKYLTKEDLIMALEENYSPWRWDHVDKPLERMSAILIKYIMLMPKEQYHVETKN